MKIGFTGTRDKMTNTQINTLTKLLENIRFTEFHHGDCKGADFQADRIVRLIINSHTDIYWRDIKIKIHPPDNDKWRAFCKGYDEDYKPKPYLERNRNIVDSTDLLIATPNGIINNQRSGTWYTISYAYQNKKPVMILV